jgi:hypothetical protein
MDEMSLAEEESAQTPESSPDTLDVGDDSIAILQGTMNDLRRPLLIAGAVAGTAALLAVGLGVLFRMVKGDAVRHARDSGRFAPVSQERPPSWAPTVDPLSVSP